MSLPLTADTLDAVAVADDLARHQVVPAARLESALAQFPGGGGAALVDYLLQLELLTPLQAERVVAGRACELAVGPYRVTGALGRGAFGPLLRAEGKGAAKVAVRVLPLRSLWQAKQAGAVVKAFAALPPNPGFVPLAAVGSARDCHYVVWPLVEGERLTRRVRKSGPRPAAAVARLVARLAGGLAALHRRGLGHGLVTPRAVLLGADDEARLMECGAGLLLGPSLAGEESLLDTLTAARGVAGMLDCAAPEWVAAPGPPTAAADQFGLGCVAHFALTGRYPFPGRTIPDRLASRRAGPPAVVETLSGVPPALADAIGRMLDPDPAARFVSFDEVLDALAGVADGLPGVADDGPISVAAAALPSYSCASASMSGTRSGTAPAWASGSGLNSRPVERDESAASVSFDLPAAEAEPQPPPPTLVRGPAAGRPAPPAEAPAAPDLQIEFHNNPPGMTALDMPALGPADTRPLAAAGTDTPTGRTPPPVADGNGPADPPTPRLAGLLGRFDGRPGPLAPPPDAPPPPARLTPDDLARAGRTPDADPDYPPAKAGALRRLRRKVLFWQSGPEAGEAEVSVFGPVRLAPGEAATVEVFVHPPEKAGHVRTLARALRPGVERIGGGRLAVEVARGESLAVHLSAATAGVAAPLRPVAWQGDTGRCMFELRVPWDAGAGPAPAVVSVGRDNVRVGKADIAFQVLPKK